jgi:hypothetical protein
VPERARSRYRIPLCSTTEDITPGRTLERLTGEVIPTENVPLSCCSTDAGLLSEGRVCARRPDNFTSTGTVAPSHVAYSS